jgi:hypothetical protein
MLFLLSELFFFVFRVVGECDFVVDWLILLGDCWLDNHIFRGVVRQAFAEFKRTPQKKKPGRVAAEGGGVEPRRLSEKSHPLTFNCAGTIGPILLPHWYDWSPSRSPRKYRYSEFCIYSLMANVGSCVICSIINFGRNVFQSPVYISLSRGCGTIATTVADVILCQFMHYLLTKDPRENGLPRYTLSSGLSVTPTTSIRTIACRVYISRGCYHWKTNM